MVTAQWLNAPVEIPTVRKAFGESDLIWMRNDERQQESNRRAEREVAQVLRACGDAQQDLPGIVSNQARAVAISPRILAATIVVESSCRDSIVSPRGAVGLMQVNERVWKTGANLRNPETNIRVGAIILAAYVQKYGIREGLHHYNGMGDASSTYSDKVLAAARAN